MNFKDHFYYDETSPTFLRRAKPWVTGNGGVREPVGAVAGYFHHSGYIHVKIGDTSYAAHRVVWELFNGEIPDGLIIDHEDGHRANNKRGNLRLIIEQENSRNTKMRITNKSGVTGVSKLELADNNGRTYVYWRATWKSLSGKQQGKSFRIDKHGDEAAFLLAMNYRAKQIAELNNIGAGYTPRHGKDTID